MKIKGGRVLKSHVSELETIWAASLAGPARIGISIDYGGRVLSKVEVERDFQFTVGDVVKMGNVVFRIKSMKTITSKIRRRAPLQNRLKGSILDSKS